MRPTIEDIERLKECLDKQNVPSHGRVVRYFDEELKEVCEIKATESMSPRDLLNSIFKKDVM